MKKDKCLYIIIIGFTLLLISVISFLSIFYEDQQIEELNLLDYSNEVREFDLSDYKGLMEEFARNKTVQKITDGETAKEEPEKLWVEIYGEKVRKEKPYNAFYDKKEDVWLIIGSAPLNSFGGEPNALIRTNGKVIAVWRDA